jgi:MYXO-CTERM domain-containing protein
MRKLPILAAALALAVPSLAVAQDTTTDATMSTAPVQDDDDDFPWGLLGLLGLAGLLGRKRNDHVNTDRRV